MLPHRRSRRSCGKTYTTSTRRAVVNLTASDVGPHTPPHRLQTTHEGRHARLTPLADGCTTLTITHVPIASFAHTLIHQPAGPAPPRIQAYHYTHPPPLPQPHHYLSAATLRMLQWFAPLATDRRPRHSSRWHSALTGRSSHWPMLDPWALTGWKRDTTFTTGLQPMRTATRLCLYRLASSRTPPRLTHYVLSSRSQSSRTPGLTTTFGRLWHLLS
jgi:hypothetical protein